MSGGGFSYVAKNSEDSVCPQFGVWTDGPMNANVFCKSSGVDQDDACENDPCSENAICIDQFEV